MCEAFQTIICQPSTTSNLGATSYMEELNIPSEDERKEFGIRYQNILEAIHELYIKITQ